MKPLPEHIVVTDFDRNRLNGLLRVLRHRSSVHPSNLDALELELQRAQIVLPECVPGDVVTMNSHVELRDLATGTLFLVKLVFPDAEKGRENCVPVLSPMGVALLGRRAGHVLQWVTEGGTQRIRIESVTYQPEASGDYFA